MMAVSLTQSGCAKLKSRDELNKGVRPPIAKQQVQPGHRVLQGCEGQRSSTLTNARLYLATAYATRCAFPRAVGRKRGMGQAGEGIPGPALHSRRDQQHFGHRRNRVHPFQHGRNSHTRARFEESKTYHLKHIMLKPEDPEPYYWIGVIDWTLTYRANLETRGAWRLSHPGKPLKDDDPMPPDVAAITSRRTPIDR